MSEQISVTEVTYEVKQRLIGIPLVIAIAWLPPDKILLGRGNQRWLMTIQEIPTEK